MYDSRIQELDGGFFEKFGTLLREPPPSADEVPCAAPGESVPGEGAPADDDLSTAAAEGGAQGGAEGGTVRTAAISGRMDISDSEGDSSAEEGQKEMLNSSVGWNVSTSVLSSLYFLSPFPH